MASLWHWVHGGSSNRGTVFSIHKDGTGDRILYSFTGLGGDGPSLMPPGRQRCLLYARPIWAGDANAGTLFQINKDAPPINILHRFGSGDGQTPEIGADLKPAMECSTAPRASVARTLSARSTP